MTTPPTDKRDDLDADIDLVKFWLPDEDAPKAHESLDRIRAALMQSPPQEVLKAAVEALKMAAQTHLFAMPETIEAANKTIAQLQPYVKGE